MTFFYYLAGLASGLMAGLTVITVSLATKAWLTDRKARHQPRPTVVDTQWKVLP